VLKIVTVLVIAGGVFAYYLDSLRCDKVSTAKNRSFAIAALAMVVFAVVVGFVSDRVTSRAAVRVRRRPPAIRPVFYCSGTAHQVAEPRAEGFRASRDYPGATESGPRPRGASWIR
jgi:hypothetical protein